ncbi:MAG: VWA domain-containing protein [PVC group bacterium]
MKKAVLLIAASILFSGPAAARTVNIEYILDASGSMLEQIQDAMKIDIAKKTLSELVDQLPRGSTEIEINVGLRVYGHSTVSGDSSEKRCRDTVLEIPVKGVDAGGIKDLIAGITARGWTPIAYSLLQAKNDFPEGAGNDNVIILISDGKETCGGDPCAVARELHEAGIKVRIHVVGFDIKPDERAQLECIAQAAGGKYFNADSAGELNRALTDVQEQVLKTESSSVRIKVGGVGRLRFEPASWVPGAPYRFRLESIADGKVAASGGSNLEELMVPPGTYRLVWDQTEHGHDDTVLSDNIVIKPDETTVFKLNTGINLVPATWLKEPPRHWYLKDPKTGEAVITVRGNWDPALAPAGVYELWYRQTEHGTNDVRLAGKVVIEEGKVTEFDVNTGITVAPSSSGAKEPYNWVLKPKDPGNTEVWAQYYWGPVPCAPGKYSFSLRQTEHGHSLIELVPEFTIETGQLVELEM